jgi:hypothetical protein
MKARSSSTSVRGDARLERPTDTPPGDADEGVHPAGMTEVRYGSTIVAHMGKLLSQSQLTLATLQREVRAYSLTGPPCRAYT